jgi:hypothetical protein
VHCSYTRGRKWIELQAKKRHREREEIERERERERKKRREKRKRERRGEKRERERRNRKTERGTISQCVTIAARVTSICKRVRREKERE